MHIRESGRNRVKVCARACALDRRVSRAKMICDRREEMGREDESESEIESSVNSIRELN